VSEWHFDPDGGDDTQDGAHRHRPLKTLAGLPQQAPGGRYKVTLVVQKPKKPFVVPPPQQQQQVPGSALRKRALARVQWLMLGERCRPDFLGFGHTVQLEFEEEQQQQQVPGSALRKRALARVQSLMLEERCHPDFLGFGHSTQRKCMVEKPKKHAKRRSHTAPSGESPATRRREHAEDVWTAERARVATSARQKREEARIARWTTGMTTADAASWVAADKEKKRVARVEARAKVRRAKLRQT
jgi:hypothetical protein